MPHLVLLMISLVAALAKSRKLVSDTWSPTLPGAAVISTGDWCWVEADKWQAGAIQSLGMRHPLLSFMQAPTPCGCRRQQIYLRTNQCKILIQKRNPKRSRRRTTLGLFEPWLYDDNLALPGYSPGSERRWQLHGGSRQMGVRRGVLCCVLEKASGHMKTVFSRRVRATPDGAAPAGGAQEDQAGHGRYVQGGRHHPGRPSSCPPSSWPTPCTASRAPARLQCPSFSSLALQSFLTSRSQ